MINGTGFKIPKEHVDLKLLQQVIDDKGGSCTAQELLTGDGSAIQGYDCCDYCVGYLRRVRLVKA